MDKKEKRAGKFRVAQVLQCFFTCQDLHGSAKLKDRLTLHEAEKDKGRYTDKQHEHRQAHEDGRGSKGWRENGCKVLHVAETNDVTTGFGCSSRNSGISGSP